MWNEKEKKQNHTKKLVDEKYLLAQSIDNITHRTNNDVDDIDKRIEVINQSILKLKTNNPKPPICKDKEPRQNLKFEMFLERQVRELEDELECPVCLEVITINPVYKCSDDHLICKECRPKVDKCPQCRNIYPRGEYKRFRVAEKQVDKLMSLIRERKEIVEENCQSVQ